MCTSRNDIYDNGHGADKVRDELTNAQKAQREEADAIEQASEATQRSTEAISNSQQANREIADTERSDAEIIAESQSILARIRERKQ